MSLKIEAAATSNEVYDQDEGKMCPKRQDAVEADINERKMSQRAYKGRDREDVGDQKKFYPINYLFISA